MRAPGDHPQVMPLRGTTMLRAGSRACMRPPP